MWAWWWILTFGVVGAVFYSNPRAVEMVQDAVRHARLSIPDPAFDQFRGVCEDNPETRVALSKARRYYERFMHEAHRSEPDEFAMLRVRQKVLGQLYRLRFTLPNDLKREARLIELTDAFSRRLQNVMYERFGTPYMWHSTKAADDRVT